MELKIALKKLEESKDFRSWHNKNKDIYFSYAFKIPQEMPQDEWHLGYYNKENDRITTFMLSNKSINVRKEEEIFKREDTQVNKVELGKIIITFTEAMSRSSEFQQKNYPKDSAVKTIAILQNMHPYGHIWNITYITEAFNTLNMKIDASTGKVIEHNLSSIFSFRKE